MSEELTESEMFVLLAKRRRRSTIRILRESTAPVSVMELARRIGEETAADPTAEEARTVSLTLRHNHLPRLDEADVVEYDAEGGTVRPGVNFDTLAGILELVTEWERPWTDG